MKGRDARLGEGRGGWVAEEKDGNGEGDGAEDGGAAAKGAAVASCSWETVGCFHLGRIISEL